MSITSLLQHVDHVPLATRLPRLQQVCFSYSTSIPVAACQYDSCSMSIRRLQHVYAHDSCTICMTVATCVCNMCTVAACVCNMCAVAACVCNMVQPAVTYAIVIFMHYVCCDTASCDICPSHIHALRLLHPQTSTFEHTRAQARTHVRGGYRSMWVYEVEKYVGVRGKGVCGCMR